MAAVRGRLRRAAGRADRGGGPGVSEAAGRPSGGRAAAARPGRGAGEVAGDRRSGGGAAGGQAQGARAVGGGRCGQPGGRGCPTTPARRVSGCVGSSSRAAGACYGRSRPSASSAATAMLFQADPVATDERHGPAEGEHPGEPSCPAQADEPADAVSRIGSPLRPRRRISPPDFAHGSVPGSARVS